MELRIVQDVWRGDMWSAWRNKPHLRLLGLGVTSNYGQAIVNEISSSKKGNQGVNNIDNGTEREDFSKFKTMKTSSSLPFLGLYS
jgi:hypothetical protein